MWTGGYWVQAFCRNELGDVQLEGVEEPCVARGRGRGCSFDMCYACIRYPCSRTHPCSPPSPVVFARSSSIAGVVRLLTQPSKKKQLYGNAEDGCRGTGEVAVDDDWVQGLYDMEGMSADTA